jgi:hypothetical protein
VLTCRAARHGLRKCKEFPELPTAARLDLVREHDLRDLCLGRCEGKIKGNKCRWRNQIHMELCREN